MRKKLSESNRRKTQIKLRIDVNYWDQIFIPTNFKKATCVRGYYRAGTVLREKGINAIKENRLDKSLILSSIEPLLNPIGK